MRAPYFEVVCGDVVEALRGFPDGSVQCVVTSPPYHALRDYEGAEGQIGQEPTFAEWVGRMVGVFREVRRVLRRDGTLWLNVGRSYAGARSFQGKVEGTDGVFERRDPAFKSGDLVMQGHLLAEALRQDGWWLRSDCVWRKNAMPESVTSRPSSTHENVFLLTKSPDYFFDMEAVRTILQPKSLTHRGGGRNGLERSAKETGRLEPSVQVRKPNSSGANLRTVWEDVDEDDPLDDIWSLSVEPFPGRHFAVFPTKLVDRCVRAGTSERGCCPSCGAPWLRTVTKGEPDLEHRLECGSDPSGGYSGTSTKSHEGAGVQDASVVKARILAGMRRRVSMWAPGCECLDPRGLYLDPQPCLVLDPFTGSGRTGKASVALGRDFVGTELVPAYAEMARANIGDPEWERKERARIRAERKSAGKE